MKGGAAFASPPPVEPGVDSDGLGYSGAEPINLTIFDHDTDRTIAGIDITAAQMEALRGLAAMRHKTIAELLQNGLDYVLKKKATLRMQAESVCQAAAAANALSHLAEHHLQYRQQFPNDNFAGNWGEDFNFGFNFLAEQTRRNLKGAVEVLMETIYAEASLPRSATES